jgi:lipopolysaccharide/colanic/teichoic acid biosynthesis glycosyltransferase
LKRTFDFCSAFFGLIVLSPLFLGVSIFIYATMGRPILFKQARTGLNGRSFKILKFRTMTEQFPDGNSLPDAERITRLGNVLRRTSLDELPELWNVLWGDMSLVGPRPLLIEYLALYSDHQAIRHQVRPGLTGWAQVNGRNALSWEERFNMDVWYVQNRGFWLDIRILFMTVRTVIKQRGINADDEVTMPKFTGGKK